MHMGFFVKILLRELDKIINENTGYQDPDILFQSEKTQADLRELLNQYVSSKEEITSEDSFAPFYDFLRTVWEEIAATKSSYHSHLNTKGNQYCDVLASHIIVACNKFKYRSREKNDYLMPLLTMTAFVQRALKELDKIPIHSVEEHGLFIYLKSEVDIEELKKMLWEQFNSKEVVTWKALKPFMALLQKRWEEIEGSEHDYQVNPSTYANRMYQAFATFLCRTINFYVSDNTGLNEKKILMPVYQLLIDKIKVNEKIKEKIFHSLKQEENLQESWQHYTNYLRRTDINMMVFAQQLLLEMEQLKKDDLQELDLDVYLESKHALIRLKTLLMQYYKSKEPITQVTLAPFIQFLKERWDLIDGTKVSNEANLNTAANQFCTRLSEYLSLAGYQINYLNRDRERLLKPVPHHGRDKMEAERQLKLSIVNYYANNYEEMITELMSIDKSKWRDFVNNIELGSFIKLMSGGEATTVDNLPGMPRLYNANEARSKAILFCLFDIYSKDRNRIGSAHKTYLGWAINHFTAVPTLQQKNNAVYAIQERFMSDDSLYHIMEELNDPSSGLAKHKFALSDCTLKLFVDEIPRTMTQLKKDRDERSEEEQKLVKCVK